jgi:hypothetical protein
MKKIFLSAKYVIESLVLLVVTFGVVIATLITAGPIMLLDRMLSRNLKRRRNVKKT